jgi:hypothetical protein
MDNMEIEDKENRNHVESHVLWTDGVTFTESRVRRR